MKRKPLYWLRNYWPLVLAYMAGSALGFALGWAVLLNLFP